MADTYNVMHDVRAELMAYVNLEFAAWAKRSPELREDKAAAAAAIADEIASRSDWPEDDDSDGSPTKLKGRDNWEMQGIPPTPRTANMPYTPRTTAFNALERKLPLRQ